MPINTVSKIGNNKWKYRVTDQYGNRREIQSKKNETWKAFKKRCDEFDQKVLSGVKNETFEDLYNYWIEKHVIPNLSNAERKTVIGIYKNHLKSYLGRKNIYEIKRKDVFQVLSRASEKGANRATIQKIRGCISRPYNWAINTLGYEMRSPTEGLIFSSDKEVDTKRCRVVSNKDWEEIKKALDMTKYKNYFLLLYHLGLRPSECLGLQIQDIKKDNLEIRRAITRHDQSGLKTNTAKRDIPLTETTKAILKKQKKLAAFRSPEGWLFPSESGQPSMNAIESAFKLLIKRAAVKLSLYDFRHSFATRMAENGMNQKVLQYMMGHKSYETTAKYYIDVTENMLDEAKNLLEKLG